MSAKTDNKNPLWEWSMRGSLSGFTIKHLNLFISVFLKRDLRARDSAVIIALLTNQSIITHAHLFYDYYD